MTTTGGGSGSFKFDADTAAYNAKMEEAKRKALDVAKGWASAIPVLGQLTTGVGALGLAVAGIQSKWEAWLQRLAAADKISQQLVERLAGAAGGAGMLGQFPALKKAIEGAAGPLTVEQRVGAFEQFTNVFGGASPEQGQEAVRQAQQASTVLGPGGVPAFVQALATAMDAGMEQRRAGDLALLVAQSGPAGASAFEKAANEFVERFGAGGGGADFQSFLASAGSDVFGSKGLRGGLAIQRGLGGVGGALDRASAEAAAADPRLAFSQRLAGAKSRTEVLSENLVGDRGRLLRQYDEIQAAAEQLGGGYMRSVRRPEDTGTLGGAPSTSLTTLDQLQRIVERELTYLEMAQEAAARDAGAARFRTEAHEEREP